MKKDRLFTAAGVLLCALALAFSIALQQAGYLTYLNSDMASEVILARRQHDTGSLVQFDWLYSTEVHTVHMNLLYALAFCFTSSYKLARIIGNTTGFMIGMAALYALLRRLRFGRGAALGAAALLPFSASALYASNMTIGGYYIVHLPFAFGTAALWLAAAEEKKKRRLAALSALCFAMGLLSVRYVLCFACPLLVCGAMEALRAERTPESVPRAAAAAALGFACCCLGYGLSEVLVPRLFVSGTGAASSFSMNPPDGGAMLEALSAVAADFLKLLGLRGDVPLFSAAGIADVLLLAVLALSVLLVRRCARRGMPEAERRMLALACWAFAVNLLCFVFVRGTYLNRYLILAVLYFIPALPVLLRREENAWLRRCFVLLLAAQLSLSGLTLWRETARQERENALRAADASEAGDWLLSEGYSAGYGTYWHIRTLEERTGGRLTFTGVVPRETEEGAACPVSPDFIRWLEPDERSDLDHVPGKTFLLLTREEEKQLSAWLAFAGTERIHENGTFAVYGFSSGPEMVNAMLLARAKLEGAAFGDGAWRFSPGGRLRVPTSWREAGRYRLSFAASGDAPGSALQLYRGNGFECFAEWTPEEGENAFEFDFPRDDKYFMLLIRAGDAPLTVRDIRLEKR